MALLTVFNELIRRDLQRCGVLSKTIELNGSHIHYYDAPGRPGVPPTLLVHGFGDSANTWYQAIVPLARALGRIVAFDFPGVGFSTLPQGKEFATVQEHLVTLQAFARAELREPALLVGHSLGGALALAAASEQGSTPAKGRKTKHDQWKAVVAISPAGARLTDEQWDKLRAGFDVTDRASARALLRRLFSVAPWPLMLVENDIRAIFRSAPVRGLLDSIDPDDFLTQAQLAAIDIPCLILWGTEERLLPPALVDYYRKYLPPHGTLEVMEGWPHASQMERPTEVTDRIIRFAQTAGVV